MVCILSIVYGPKWPDYSCDWIYWIYIAYIGYIALFGTGICRFCIWIELPVQRRLCPIFVRNAGSLDMHDCFRGLTGSQRTPGFGASQVKFDWSYNYDDSFIELKSKLVATLILIISLGSQRFVLHNDAFH